MSVESSKAYVAFAGTARIAAGALQAVALAARSAAHDQGTPVTIFEEETGEVVEVDLRGTAEDLMARLIRAWNAHLGGRKVSQLSGALIDGWFPKINGHKAG